MPSPYPTIPFQLRRWKHPGRGNTLPGTPARSGQVSAPFSPSPLYRAQTGRWLGASEHLREARFSVHVGSEEESSSAQCGGWYAWEGIASGLQALKAPEEVLQPGRWELSWSFSHSQGFPQEARAAPTGKRDTRLRKQRLSQKPMDTKMDYPIALSTQTHYQFGRTW